MWHLHNNQNHYYIPQCPHTYWVGRKKNLCKIRITGDKSISRKHCRIIIGRKASKYVISIEDCSKFGTYVNNERLRSGIEEKVEVGDNTTVQFGTDLKFKLKYETYSCCLSGFTDNFQGRDKLMGRLKNVGWTVHPTFRTDISFLLVRAEGGGLEDNNNVSFPLALAHAIQIVGLQFLEETERRQNNPVLDIRFPDIRNFEPTLPVSMKKNNNNPHHHISLSPDERRREVFVGISFVFLDRHEMEKWTALINFCGGLVRDLSDVIIMNDDDLFGKGTSGVVYIEGFRDDRVKSGQLRKLGFIPNEIGVLTRCVLTVEPKKILKFSSKIEDVVEEEEDDNFGRGIINPKQDEDEEEEDSTTGDEDNNVEKKKKIRMSQLQQHQRKRRVKKKVLMAQTLPQISALDEDVFEFPEEEEEEEDVIPPEDEQKSSKKNKEKKNKEFQIPSQHMKSSQEQEEEEDQEKKKNNNKKTTKKRNDFVGDSYVIHYFDEHNIEEEERNDELQNTKLGGMKKTHHQYYNVEEETEKKGGGGGGGGGVVNYKLFRKVVGSSSSSPIQKEKEEEEIEELEFVELEHYQQIPKKKKKRKKKKDEEEEEEEEESDDSEDDDDDDEELFDYQAKKRKTHASKKTSRRKRRRMR